MNFVFCADRAMLAGLHVATLSVLESLDPVAGTGHFHIFSDALDAADLSLLERTLAGARKPFELKLGRIHSGAFKHLPPLNGSWATYYRLLVAEYLGVDRYLYVDADTLCDVDVSELQALEMNSAAVAWSLEAPLPRAVDRQTAEQLGNSQSDFSFNAGVMLINVPEWRRQRVSERAMEYIVNHRPEFHDQAALNYVLHGTAMTLDPKFNCIANMRKNWPALKKPYGDIGKLVHFVDYPKPWDLGAEYLHPQYRLWRSVLDQTALAKFRSWHGTAARVWPRSRSSWTGYKKALKDRLLFTCYSRGWLQHVKGVPRRGRACFNSCDTV